MTSYVKCPYCILEHQGWEEVRLCKERQIIEEQIKNTTEE